MVDEGEVLLWRVDDVEDLRREFPTQRRVHLRLVVLGHRNIKVGRLRLSALEAAAVGSEEIILDRRALSAARLVLEHDCAHVGAPAHALHALLELIDLLVPEDSINAVRLSVALRERRLEGKGAAKAAAAAASAASASTLAEAAALAALAAAALATSTKAGPSASTVIPTAVATPTEARVAFSCVALYLQK